MRLIGKAINHEPLRREHDQTRAALDRHAVRAWRRDARSVRAQACARADQAEGPERRGRGRRARRRLRLIARHVLPLPFTWPVAIPFWVAGLWAFSAELRFLRRSPRDRI